MAAHFLFRSGGCLSPAPSLFKLLTVAARDRQEETARACVDGRRELPPGAPCGPYGIGVIPAFAGIQGLRGSDGGWVGRRGGVT